MWPWKKEDHEGSPGESDSKGSSPPSSSSLVAPVDSSLRRDGATIMLTHKDGLEKLKEKKRRKKKELKEATTGWLSSFSFAQTLGIGGNGSIRLKMNIAIQDDGSIRVAETLVDSESCVTEDILSAGLIRIAKDFGGLSLDDLNTRARTLSVLSEAPFRFRITNAKDHLLPLRSLKELQSLEMHRHELTGVIAEISSMTKLRCLSLRENGIKTLSAQVSTLRLLERLDLTGNSLSSIPDEIGSLKALLVLKLGRNAISSLPSSIGNITSLRHLYVHHNKLSALPPQISSLESLEIVSLGHNVLTNPSRPLMFGTKTYEDYFCNLCKLRSILKLKLSHNKLTALPDEISGMSRLTLLDVSNNRLHTIASLCMGQLTTIDLRNNHLKKLPHTNLPLLTHVALSGNKLSKPPEGFFSSLSCVTDMDLSDNLLKTIPDAIGRVSRSLRRLCVSHNQIEELPMNIYDLPQLEVLDVSHNLLAGIPVDISRLTRLRKLLLSHNTIVNVPARPLGNMVRLKILDLSHNKLVSIGILPREDATTKDATLQLEVLHLHGNPLRSLHRRFHTLTSLQELSVCNVLVRILRPRGGGGDVDTTNSGGISKSPRRVDEPDEDELRTAVYCLDEQNREKPFELSDEELSDILTLAQTSPHTLLLFPISVLAQEHHGTAERLIELGVLSALSDLMVLPPLSDDVLYRTMRIISRISEYSQVLNTLYHELSLGTLVAILRAAKSDCEARTQVETARVIANLAFDPHRRREILSSQPLESLCIDICQNHHDSEVKMEAFRLLNVLGAHSALHKLHLPEVQKRREECGLRILCLDGGGSRGLATIVMLRKLEELTGGQTYQLFDLICGTSTGSLLAIGLGTLRLSIDDLENLYKNLNHVIFSSSGQVDEGTIGARESSEGLSLEIDPKATAAKSREQGSWTRWVNTGANLLKTGGAARYKSGPLEHFLKTICKSSKFIDTTRETSTKVFAVSTAMNRSRPIEYLFRNYEYAASGEHTSRYEGSSQASLVEGLRASTAAPTYFDPVLITDGHGQTNTFVDGGLMANNPSSVAIHEAKRIWPDYDIDCVVSMGTGAAPIQVEEVSLYNNVHALVRCSTDVERIHHAMEDLMVVGEQYFRFQPINEAFKAELDSIADDELSEMQRAAERYVDEHQEEFRKCAERLLVQARELRPRAQPSCGEGDE